MCQNKLEYVEYFGEFLECRCLPKGNDDDGADHSNNDNYHLPRVLGYYYYYYQATIEATSRTASSDCMRWRVPSFISGRHH